MATYILRRLVQTVVLLLFLSGLIFFILHLVPGGPFDLLSLSNPRITDTQIKQLEILLGLDKPIHERYFSWLWKAITGDLGSSWGVSYGQSVGELIVSRLGNTLILTGVSMAVSMAIALPVGVYSAIKQRTWIDYFVTFFSFFGISMPTFWFGVMLLILFSVRFDWFHAGGVSCAGLENDFGDRLNHMVLPVVVLSMVNVAQWSRYIRSSMLDVLHQDYLRTARAKGLSERVVIVKHAVRNALIPVVTLIGLEIPLLFGGAIITEQIFAWPGMGRLYYDGVMNSDWPLVQGIMVIMASLVVLSNLLADVFYSIVDPRIKHG